AGRPVRAGAAVLIVVAYLGVAGLRYRRLSPALRRLVREHRYALPLALVQAATVPAIALAWGTGSAVAQFLLTPLLIVSFGVGPGMAPVGFPPSWPVLAGGGGTSPRYGGSCPAPGWSR